MTAALTDLVNLFRTSANAHQRLYYLHSIYSLPEYKLSWPMSVSKSGYFQVLSEVCEVSQMKRVGFYLDNQILLLGSNDDCFVVAEMCFDGTMKFSCLRPFEGLVPKNAFVQMQEESAIIIADARIVADEKVSIATAATVGVRGCTYTSEDLESVSIGTVCGVTTLFTSQYDKVEYFFRTCNGRSHEKSNGICDESIVNRVHSVGDVLKGNTFSAVVQELNKDEIVVIRKMDEAVGNPKSRVIEVLMSNMGNFVTRENLHKLIDHLHESGSFDVQQVFKANTKSIGCAEFIVLENIHEPTVVKF